MRPNKSRSRSIPLGLLVVLLIGLGGAFPYFEQVRNANEVPRLMQGMALVEAGTMAIDGPEMRGMRAGPDVARSPENGRLYPNKPPGATVVAAFAFGVGSAVDAIIDRTYTLRDYTWWARILGGLLPTLLLCGFVFRRHEDLRGRAAICVAIAIYAFGTPAASYSHLFYGHQLAAMLLFVGVSWCVDAAGVHDPKLAALGGAIAATAVTVEYGAVFAGLPVAAIFVRCLFKPEGARVVLAALAGALVPIVVLGLYHQDVFGSAMATGYHHAANPDFAAKHSVGLLGLRWPTFDGVYTHILAHASGILWWAPLWLIGTWGLVEMSFIEGARRTEARVWLVITLLLTLVGTGLSFEGGWRVGPRYLVVALPGLMIGLAHEYDRMRSNPVALAVFALLATWSVVVNGLAANLWPHFDLTNVNSPLGEVLLPLLSDGYEPYGIAWLLGMPGSAWLPILLGVLALWWYAFRGLESSPRAYTALAVGAVLGLGCVWATPWFFDRHEMGERNLEYIERVYEPQPGADEAGKSRDLDVAYKKIRQSDLPDS